MANLESRLQELSETVGTYDRLRQNDQMSMQKLRDRIAQLDLENQSLQNVRRNDSLPGRMLYCRLTKIFFSIIKKDGYCKKSAVEGFFSQKLLNFVY